MLRFLQYFVVFLVLWVTGCTMHFKASEIEVDTKPATPGLVQSNHTYELEKITLLN